MISRLFSASAGLLDVSSDGRYKAALAEIVTTINGHPVVRVTGKVIFDEGDCVVGHFDDAEWAIVVIDENSPIQLREALEYERYIRARSIASAKLAGVM